LIAAGVAFLYAIMNMIVVLHIHGSIDAFYRSMFMSYTIPFTILVGISSILLGISSSLLVAKIFEIKVKTAGLNITGIFFGSLAAGCPGCFFGLFPIVLSFFGITGTLAILPFNGLELQVGAIFVILLSIWFLAVESEVVCTLPGDREESEEYEDSDDDDDEEDEYEEEQHVPYNR
jgi:hypothetical protein